MTLIILSLRYFICEIEIILIIFELGLGPTSYFKSTLNSRRRTLSTVRFEHVTENASKI